MTILHAWPHAHDPRETKMMEDGEETTRKMTDVNSDLSQELVGVVITSFCMLFKTVQVFYNCVLLL